MKYSIWTTATRRMSISTLIMTSRKATFTTSSIALAVGGVKGFGLCKETPGIVKRQDFCCPSIFSCIRRSRSCSKVGFVLSALKALTNPLYSSGKPSRIVITKLWSDSPPIACRASPIELTFCIYIWAYSSLLSWYFSALLLSEEAVDAVLPRKLLSMVVHASQVVLGEHEIAIWSILRESVALIHDMIVVSFLFHIAYIGLGIIVFISNSKTWG